MVGVQILLNTFFFSFHFVRFINKNVLFNLQITYYDILCYLYLQSNQIRVDSNDWTVLYSKINIMYMYKKIFSFTFKSRLFVTWSRCCRYSILAPNVIPRGFVDGRVVTEKVLEYLQTDPSEYRLGNPSSTFFKFS